MTYEIFFEAVKRILVRQLDISGEKVEAYMKSEEGIIKGQYMYWQGKYDGGDIEGYASGAAYSLYLLYEGQASFLIKEVQLYVLIWEEKMVL